MLENQLDSQTQSREKYINELISQSLDLIFTQANRNLRVFIKYKDQNLDGTKDQYPRINQFPINNKRLNFTIDRYNTQPVIFQLYNKI